MRLRFVHPCHGASGFTLLELLMVVTILSAMAWMSLDSVGTDLDQVRYDDTRNRLQSIRRAIVGDTSRTVNGAPMLSGYVADMGGPPPRLNALIQQRYCPNHPEILYDPASPGSASAACIAEGETYAEQPNYTYDATHGLWHGWNGPYLRAAELAGDYPKFQDGWGGGEGLSDNFGWAYAVDSPDAGDITIQSYGRDGASGPGPALPESSPYDVDYPRDSSQPYIPGSAYRSLLVSDGGTPSDASDDIRVTVDFGAPPACWVCSGATPALSGEISWTNQTCADAGHTWAPAYGKDAATCEDIDDSTPGNEVDATWQPTESLCLAFVTRDGAGKLIATPLASGEVSVTWDGSPKQLAFDFAGETYVNLGTVAYGIFNYNGATNTCDTTSEFPGGSTLWKNFTHVPGMAPQPFYYPLTR